jgi:hypothetical protein
MKYLLLALLLSAVYAVAQVSYPVGTVIEVTDDGVTVTAPEEEVDNPVAEDPVVYVDEGEYCYGADYALVDCDASRNYDPWIASTGEKAYWLRNQLTISIPFTLPSRDDADNVRYGYFQMTTPQPRRDPVKSDVFRVWFSSEPNGDPLGGGGSRCEKWLVQARGNFLWTQDQSLSSQACFLGHESRVLYANFETACYAPRYEGSCSDTNKQKSASSYQFDVARLVRAY